MNNRLNLVVNFAAIDKLSGPLKNLVGLGKSGAQKFRDMARETRRLEGELAGVRRELKGAAGNVSALVDRERELERAIGAANKKFERQAALNRIDAKAEAMRARGAGLRSRGRDNMVGGAAMLGPLLLAGKLAGDFSSGMVDIQQKAELSAAATEKLRNNILAAATASHQMPEDMRAAVDTLAGLGLNPEEAVRAARPMGRFMTAFKVEGTDAAASVFAGFQNLNIPLERTGKLLDMMAEGGNQGAFEARDMAAALPGLTAQMKGLGQTGTAAGAELIAALEIVRRGTGSSDAAATNVENLLAKLTAPTTVAAFKKNFGVDVPAAIKSGAKAGITPLETMIKLTRKATGGDLMKLGFAFQDMQAQTAMRQLMLDYEDFAAMKKQVGAASGTTDRAFDVRIAGDQTVALRDLGGAMANLALAAAPVLLPFLRQVTDYMTRAAAALSNWAQRHPAAAGMLLKLVAGLGMARIALGGLQFAFGGLLGPMATVFKFANQLRVFGSAAPMLLRLTGAFKAFGQTFLWIGRLMLTNPIGLLVTAIGIAAYLIYANWDKIKAAFATGAAALGNAWIAIKAGFSAGLAWLTALPGKMLSIGINIITGLANGIRSAPGVVWNALKNVVMGGVNRIKKFLGIASPSRLFMGFGGHMAEGMAIGLDRRRSTALASARRLAAGVAGAAAIAAGPAFAGPALAPAGSRTAAPIAITATFHITGATASDAAAIQEAVERALAAARRKAEAAARSSFADD